MSNLRLIFEVGRWEFRRLFKLRDLLMTLLVAVSMGLVYLGGKTLVELASSGKARIAVLNAELLTVQAFPESSFELITQDRRSETVLREGVGRRELDGLLILHSGDEAELLVAKRPYWEQQLGLALTAARREAKLKAAKLSPTELDTILAPFQIHLRYHETGKPFNLAQIITASVITALMLIGIVLGSTYLFLGITGEKQLRVTEQVISAIPPQTWIDGKILGHAAMTLVSMINLGLGALLANLILNLFGAGITIPLALANPFLLLSFLILSSLGFFFWFSFFAAIAATVDDPNASSRSGLLFLPFLPLSLGFIGLVRDPDGWLMKLLGIFPLTSPSAMPVRLVLTKVAAWEFVATIILLVGSIWLLRRAAGKIFALGMLMYGKELSWREMLRWLKEA